MAASAADPEGGVRGECGSRGEFLRCAVRRDVGGHVGNCDAGTVVCPCRQWSRGHRQPGTLVRHVMCVDTCSADGATGSTALAPTTRALRVRDATAPGALVALCSLTPRLLADLTPASSAAIAVAAVAAAAQDDLDATTRAQVKAGGLVHAHPGTTEVLDGLVPARHTAAAPPSSARCRARCGGQASRRERPLPCPPSSASTALYRGMPTPPSDRTDGVSAGITADVEPAAPPPAPAWPPCRAARQAHTRINTQPVQQPLIASSCLAPKPPPHQRIVSDPDRRSQQPGPAGAALDALHPRHARRPRPV